MTPRATPPRGGFTLIEVLVVIAIIAILAGLTLPVIGMVRIKTWRAKARAELQALEAALASYHADLRRLPRLTKRRAPDLFDDDAPALFAALHNAPTATAGGGPSSPYLRTQLPVGKLVDRSRLAADRMGLDGVTGVVALTLPEMQLATTASYQATHGPSSAEPLVFVDLNGNPYHYREWDSVDASVRDPLQTDPPLRAGFAPGPLGGDAPIAGPIADPPRGRYQLWCNGPNGVNEFGEGDDVASWKVD